MDRVHSSFRRPSSLGQQDISGADPLVNEHMASRGHLIIWGEQFYVDEFTDGAGLVELSVQEINLEPGRVAERIVPAIQMDVHFYRGLSLK